ncbi:PQQ-binding-like beta-propeller repeat protein [Streptomyces sp. NPDC058239]|uniref:outer membrane protein assembly factor BamB family protein n=1 Tax=Streptomyces sp. NPDC058239 TaxID=3346395 RepID=UPI0036EC1AA6
MAGCAPLEAEDPGQAGPYRIVGRLGSGGMGRVYLARSPGGPTVAVKIVREELAEDPTFRRRFVREVEAARRVTGFFTAAVLDAAPEADPPWLATAYVPGLSLTEAVAAHGAWPEKPVLELGTALAEALEGIHGAEVVHRDLKPSNVLLADDGPRVIDFGISVAAGDTRLTLTGTAVGTPGYMPPEQLVGEDVGPAGDVFALGAVLAYTATGTKPFAGGSAHGVNYRVVHEEPDLGRVPARLATVVARCLAKDAKQRPSVPELIEELGQFSEAGRTAGGFTGAGWLPAPVATEITRIQDTPLPDTAPGTAPIEAPATVTVTSEQATAGAVPPTAVATAALGAAPGTDLPTPPHRQPSAGRLRGFSRRHALIGLAGATILAVPAVTLLVRDGLIDSGQSDARGKKPDVPARKLAFEELWSYEKGPVGPPVSSEGKVYFADHDGSLRALDADSGALVWSYNELKGARNSVDLPDGARHPIVVDGAVYVSTEDSGALHSVDAGTGEKRWSFEIGSERAEAGFVTFSPVAVAKGTAYVVSMYFQAESVLHALDAETGEERWHRDVDRGLTHALTVADGVIYCGLGQDFKSYLYALDADTGTPRWRIKTADDIWGKVSSIAVDGSTVYFGTENGAFYAADTTRGELRWKYRTQSDGAEWTDPPLVTDGVVYGSVKNKHTPTEEGPGRAYAFDADSGERLWTYETTYSASPVTLTGGAVHFSDTNGSLHALDPRTGKSLGDARLADDTDPSLAVSGDRAYFDGGDGRLHAGRISLTEG